MEWKMPAFGDWECVNQLPITQYFESASQAALLCSRHPASSHAGRCHFCHQAAGRLGSGGGDWRKKGGWEKRRNAGGVIVHQQHDEVPWSKHEAAATPRRRGGGLRKQQGQQGRRRPRLATAAAAAGTGGGRTKVFDLDVVTVAEQQLFSPSFSSCSSDSCSNRRRHPRHQFAAGSGKKRVEDANFLHRQTPPRTHRGPKAIDEDLYKISPHLLRSTHPKRTTKKLCFIPSCFLRLCAA